MPTRRKIEDKIFMTICVHWTCSLPACFLSSSFICTSFNFVFSRFLSFRFNTLSLIPIVEYAVTLYTEKNTKFADHFSRASHVDTDVFCSTKVCQPEGSISWEKIDIFKFPGYFRCANERGRAVIDRIIDLLSVILAEYPWIFSLKQESVYCW